jgi:YggT family protein
MVMNLLILLLIRLLDIYLWAVVVAVMLSWLIAFGVLNLKNKGVYVVCNFLNNVTRPPILFLRRFVPPLGGIDVTPMIVIFGIYLIQGILLRLMQ